MGRRWIRARARDPRRRRSRHHARRQAPRHPAGRFEAARREGMSSRRALAAADRWIARAPRARRRDGNGGALHVQRVYDPTIDDHIAAQAREEGGGGGVRPGSNGSPRRRGRRDGASSGEGAGVRVERVRRILAVAGDAPSSRTTTTIIDGGGGSGTQPAQRTPIVSSSCAVGLWRYGGGAGDGEIPVPIAVVAASPAPAPGLSVGAVPRVFDANSGCAAG